MKRADQVAAPVGRRIQAAGANIEPQQRYVVQLRPILMRSELHFLTFRRRADVRAARGDRPEGEKVLKDVAQECAEAQMGMNRAWSTFSRPTPGN